MPQKVTNGSISIEINDFIFRNSSEDISPSQGYNPDAEQCMSGDHQWNKRTCLVTNGLPQKKEFTSTNEEILVRNVLPLKLFHNTNTPKGRKCFRQITILSLFSSPKASQTRRQDAEQHSMMEGNIISTHPQRPLSHCQHQLQAYHFTTVPLANSVYHRLPLKFKNGERKH